MPFLRRLNGDQAGQCIELAQDDVVIGRLPECQIVLDPHGVSRKHARIHRQDGQFLIEDLGSRNKTRVNSTELQLGVIHTLRPRDVINICDVEFEYLARIPAPAPDPGVLVTDEALEPSTYQTLDASSGSNLTSSVPPSTKLQAIIEISRSLSSELRIDAVAPKILDSLFQIFPMTERGFLVLKDADSGRLVRKAFKHRPRSGPRPMSFGRPAPAEDEAPMSFSRSLINLVLENKKAVLSQDAGNDSNLPTSASIADLKIRSVLCAPLLTPDGQALGIIQLDTTASRQFSQDDLDLLIAVASQAAISIQNAALHESALAQDRLKRDLGLAEQIQKRFLPQSVPKPPGWQFFAHYQAAYNVGGDYYDLVPLPGDRLAIAVADVAGKGVAAALIMAKFSGDTRYCILTENAPAPAADALNQLLADSGIEDRFITLTLSILDLNNRTLTIAAAGHPPIMIRRADGRIEEAGAEAVGLPLGVAPEIPYSQVEVTLEPGDVAIAYSDGVPDARDPQDQLFVSTVRNRLTERVAAAVGGPEAVGKAIVQAVREFAAGHTPADDVTLVCFGLV